MGSLLIALGSSGCFSFVWFNSGAPRGRRIQPGFTGVGLVVVRFIRILVGSLSGRRVHSGSRVFTRKSLVVVVFIRVRLGLLGRN